MSKETGGPAFPVFDIDKGMTLRDYFAAKAMQGLCAGFASPHGGWPDSGCSEHYDVAASHAYLMADAMLRARQQ